MLQLLDDNLDGLVSLNELREAWKGAATESAGAVLLPADGELRQLFANADLDRDGFLNEDEFTGLVRGEHGVAVRPLRPQSSPQLPTN